MLKLQANVVRLFKAWLGLVIIPVTYITGGASKYAHFMM